MFANCKRALAAVTLTSFASIAAAGINTWTNVGPEGAVVQDIIVVPGTPSAYTMTMGQTFAWSDVSQAWTPLPDRYTDIDFDPTNPNRMIFATGGQLYSSTDGGATRVRVTPTQLQTYNHGGVSRVEFSRDGTVVYAADFQSVYRSDDFGASWTAGVRVSLESCG
jgi:photosystem II stability/assembly factor-like uncharacterized protein